MFPWQDLPTIFKTYCCFRTSAKTGSHGHVLMHVMSLLLCTIQLANVGIRSCISFCHQSTRSSSSHKLMHFHASTNQKRNFYFNRLLRTFNRLTVVNLTQSFTTIKFKSTTYLWQHFIDTFDPSMPITFYVLVVSAPRIQNHQTLMFYN